MKAGSVVKISYTGRVKETGEVFDTTDESIARSEGAYNPRVKYGPVGVVVGDGHVIKGLDKALEEMESGEERELEIKPEDAFGERKGDLIQTFSEREFKKQNITPYPGMRITVNNMMGRVLSVNSGRVRVDFNHPLAGKVLVYKLKIEEEVTEDRDKCKVIASFYTGRDHDVEIKDGKVRIKGVPEPLRDRVSEEIKRYVGVKDVEFEDEDEDKTEKK